MIHIFGDEYIISGGGNPELIRIQPNDIIERITELDTGGNEVYSACLLHSGQPGISFDFDPDLNPISKLIVGCANGNIVRFE